MKYYSDITKQLYETREQLFKAERDYKMELVTKARADEKARKIADLEARLAELRGETTAKTDNVKSSDKPIASEKSNKDNTAPTKVYDAGKEDGIDYSKTIEAIKKMVDNFKFKYPSFEFQDIEDDKNELTDDDIKSSVRPGEKIARLATGKTAPAKTNGACRNCGKCVKTDTEDKKHKKLADSGYYSSAYINLNGKEFYSEGADSWNDVKKAVRKYFEKLQGLK
uniref:Uncharacterized protein n=1 Tax=Siphoviridae sp. ctnpt50 TaxID=2827941 RepID=A0A8S5SEL6_9CAUD|nr:MAG TPA: hypothetical protein [Siphoviridae sp. ctnpt50]